MVLRTYRKKLEAPRKTFDDIYFIKDIRCGNNRFLEINSFDLHVGERSRNTENSYFRIVSHKRTLFDTKYWELAKRS